MIADVAKLLRNTPAVCRKSYIDPAVFEAWENARLQRAMRGARGARQWEQALLRLLRAERRGAKGRAALASQLRLSADKCHIWC